MALVRVAQYNSTPTVVEDYQAQNAHLQAFTNQLLTQQFILDSGTAQPVIKQGCYVSHGGSLYVADADTSITGSPSDGSVYIRVSGTTSLTVEFVTNISGYTWNPVYSALTSGSYTLLPYLIVKASTVWTRYNFNPNNQSVGGALTVTGAISFASLNPDNSTETSVQVSALSAKVLPKGAYAIKLDDTVVVCQIKYGSDWINIFTNPGGFVISDGVNFRLLNTSGNTNTIKMRKW